MKTDQTRYRISVPVSDKAVHDWINAQGNLSFSFRMAVKGIIRRYGYADIACMEDLPFDDALPKAAKDVAQPVSQPKAPHLPKAKTDPMEMLEGPGPAKAPSSDMLGSLLA